MSSPARIKSTSSQSSKRSAGHKALLASLGGIGVLYLGLVVYHIAIPEVRSAGADESLTLLEQCRRLCRSYGLLPTGHIANDAEAYLAAVDSKKLTGELETLLADFEPGPAETHPSPILNGVAPGFQLQDHTGAPRSSSEWIATKPMVVVFYYGYGCSHCVAQLFALNKDLALFRELGAEVVALSSDEPQHTREQYAAYGSFDFPVLSDPENRIAEKYGVFRPKTAEKPESLDHGTFVVDSRGQVIWAYSGGEPFLDNRSLLHVLAASQGLLPKTTPAKPNLAERPASTASTSPAVSR